MGGEIGSITGDFIGNHASAREQGFGGAIYNVDGTLGPITGDFIGNYASAKLNETTAKGQAKGGAIYNNPNSNDPVVTILAGDRDILFSGNYVSAASGNAKGGAIYNGSSNSHYATVNLYASEGKSITFVGRKDDDIVDSICNSGKLYINGDGYTGTVNLAKVDFDDSTVNPRALMYINGGTVNLSSDVSQKTIELSANATMNMEKGVEVSVTDALKNKGTITMKEGASISGTLNLGNGTIVTSGDNKTTAYNIGSLTGTGNIKIDVDVTGGTASATSDSFNITTGDATITISDITLIGGLTPVSVGNFSVKILNGGNANLSVDEALVNQYKTISLQKANQDFEPSVSWKDKIAVLERTITRDLTVENSPDGSTLKLATTSETGWVDKGNYGDTLFLINGLDATAKEFRFDTARDKYELTTDLSSGATVATKGTLSIIGVKDNENNLSTIDLGDYLGFVLDSNSILNISNTKIIGGRDRIAISNTGGTLNLSGVNTIESKITGVDTETVTSTVKNTGTLNISASNLALALKNDAVVNLIGGTSTTARETLGATITDSVDLRDTTMGTVNFGNGTSDAEYFANSMLITQKEITIAENADVENSGIVTAITITNAGTLTLSGVGTIRADTIINTGTITSAADKLTVTTTPTYTKNPITNDGVLNLTSGILSSAVDGNGTVSVLGYVGSTSKITNAITITGEQSGLTISASNVGNNVTVDGGTLTLQSGTLMYGVTHGTTADSSTVIAEDVIATSHGTISTSKLTINAGASLEISPDNVNLYGSEASFENNGKLITYGNLNDLSELTKDTNHGTVQIKSGETLNVTEDKELGGTLDLNGATLDMQEKGTPAYSTLTVDTLKGTGTMKIDVYSKANPEEPRTDVYSDKIVYTAADQAAITLSSIHLTGGFDLTATKEVDYLTVLSGEGTAAGTVYLRVGEDGQGISVQSGNYLYTFTNGTVNGKLTVERAWHQAEFADYIADAGSKGSFTTYSFKADETLNKSVTTGENVHVTDAIYYVDMNGKTLNGAGNNGITASETMTLELTGDGSTIQNFDTAITVDSGATLTLDNVNFSGNNTDVANNGTMIMSGTNTFGSQITGTGTATNTGTMNISVGNLCISSVTNTGTLNLAVDNASSTLATGITGDGTLNFLSSGSGNSSKTVVSQNEIVQNIVSLGSGIGLDAPLVSATSFTFAGNNTLQGDFIAQNATIATNESVTVTGRLFTENYTAVGYNAVVQSAATNSVALGSGSVASEANTVSIGSANSTRKITNLSAGTANTDAVNYGQIKSAFTSATYANNILTLTAVDGTTTQLTIAGGGGGDDPNAVHYDTSTTDKTSVPLAGSGGTTISNVKAGVADTDAVNVLQMNTELAKKANVATTLSGYGITDAYTKTDVYTKTEVNALISSGSGGGSSTAKIADSDSNATASAKGSVAIEFNSKVSEQSTGGVAIGYGATVGYTKQQVQQGLLMATNSNDTEVATAAENAVAIGRESRATIRDSVALGSNSLANEENTVSVGNAETGLTRRVTNVATPLNANDAVNKSYVDSGLSRLDERTRQVGSHAAALSALHPLPYNPDAPTSFAAGVGTYRDETSYAIGVFHYTSDRFMLNLGASITKGADVMGRAGISFSLGKSSKESVKATRKEAQQLQTALANMEQNFNNQLASQKISYEKRIQGYEERIQGYEDRTQKLEAKLEAMQKLIETKLNSEATTQQAKKNKKETKNQQKNKTNKSQKK